MRFKNFFKIKKNFLKVTLCEYQSVQCIFNHLLLLYCIFPV